MEICGKKETYAIYMLPVSNVRVILPGERKGLPDLTLPNLCGLDQRKANTKGQGIVLLTLVEWLVYRDSTYAAGFSPNRFPIDTEKEGNGADCHGDGSHVNFLNSLIAASDEPTAHTLRLAPHRLPS